MPALDRVDPATLDAVAAQLTRSSAAALEASHELLAHYADTGDASTQRTVDTLIDRAAEALRSLTDSLSEASRRHGAGASLTGGEVSLTRTGLRRGRYV
ncbi:MAG: hypothetical protein ABI899_00100 [Actinomycetota bacterium]